MNRPLAVRGAAALATALVCAGLTPVLDGDWFLALVLVVLVVASAGAVLDALRVPGPLAVLGQVLALVVALTASSAGTSAVLGLLPGPAVWEEVRALAAQGAAAITQQAPPVSVDEGLGFLVVAGGGVLALVVDLLAVRWRRPAVAGLPLLVVHAVGIGFAPGGLGVGWFCLAVGGFVLLLAVAGSPRRRWGALVPRSSSARPAPWWAPQLAGAAVVIALVAALALPALLPLALRRGPLIDGRGSSTGGSTTTLNPLLDLRGDLRNSGDTAVLSYTTDEESPEPLRIVTVDAFDGEVWTPTPVDQDDAPLLEGELPAPPGLTGTTSAVARTAEISVQGLRQQWLPLPYPARSVAVDGEWLYDPATLNVIGLDGARTEGGQDYRVDYLEVTPDAAALAGAPTAPQDVLDRYTALPGGLPASIAATALEVVDGATTEFDRAVALQDWFRATGGFTYSLDAPEPRSASAIADFLEDREGYCVHFASTMAVMARTLGIPARVAVGFLPGERSGDGWQVDVDDAHAWPELYFEGAGWVRFEPTPGARTGAAPTWTQALPESGTDPASTPSTSTAPTTTAPAPSASPSTGAAAADPSTADGAAAGTSWVRVALVVAAGGLLVLALLALPLLARTAVSARRWRTARTDAERAEAAWTDLVEQLGDLGVAVAASDTPRRVARQLAPGPEVDRVVDAVQRARYGPGAAVGAGAGVGARTGARADARVGAGADRGARGDGDPRGVGDPWEVPLPGGAVPVGAVPVGEVPGGAVPVGEVPGGAVPPDLVPDGPTDLRGDVRAVLERAAEQQPPRAVRAWRWWPPSGIRALLRR